MHDTASINKVGTLATRPCGPRSPRSHRNINGHITRLQSPSHEVPVTPNESTTETSTSINMAHIWIWFRFHARPPRRARISLLPILSNPLTSTRYNDYLQLSPKSEWYDVETNNGDPRSLAIFIFLCECECFSGREFSFSFLYLAGLFPQDTFSFTAIQIQQSSFGDDTCVNSYKLLPRNTSFQESKI